MRDDRNNEGRIWDDRTLNGRMWDKTFLPDGICSFWKTGCVLTLRRGCWMKNGNQIVPLQTWRGELRI